MKLVVGLGNPGEKYAKNRHNVGFMVIDELASKLRAAGYELREAWKESKNGKLLYLWFEADGEKLELIKPQDFVNNSGYSVTCAYKKHSGLKPRDVYVIHDDLDIALGGYKIQKGKGPRLHKGVLSIEKNLGTGDFWRVRVGVDNRSPDNRIPGETYVLQDFRKEELEKLTPVIDRIVEEIYDYLASSYKP